MTAALVATTVHSPHVPDPPRTLFSNAKRVGDRFFVSGMHAWGGGAGIIGGDSAYQQAMAAFRKIAALVDAAGAEMDDIMMLRVYVTDMQDKAEVGRARREFFTGSFPCSTLVGVTALAEPGLKVEIEAEGVVGSGGDAER